MVVLSTIVAVAVTIGISAIVKWLCKKYINSVCEKQSSKEK